MDNKMILFIIFCISILIAIPIGYVYVNYSNLEKDILSERFRYIIVIRSYNENNINYIIPLFNESIINEQISFYQNIDEMTNNLSQGGNDFGQYRFPYNKQKLIYSIYNNLLYLQTDNSIIIESSYHDINNKVNKKIEIMIQKNQNINIYIYPNKSINNEEVDIFILFYELIYYRNGTTSITYATNIENVSTLIVPILRYENFYPTFNTYNSGWNELKLTYSNYYIH